jgi:choline kinase
MSTSIGIILAAGVGSRLRPLTNNVPKCLVPIAGIPILQRQIEALLACGIGRIIVVAGYKSDQVLNFCQRYPHVVEVVVNQGYANTNNMYSFYTAAQNLGVASVLLCNGDVVFEPEIISSLLKSEWGNLISVQPNRYDDEAMKVVVDSQHRVVELSKAVSASSAYGVSIDVYKFCPFTCREILKIATRIIVDEGKRNLWTEVAIREALQLIKFRPFDIGVHRWVEIDNFADLTLANEIFASAA